MIELNLLEKKEPFRLPLILGVDLNNLNFKILGIAMVIYYLPESYIRSDFEEKMKEDNAALEKLVSENRILKKELEKDANIKTELEAYKEQVEKLNRRSSQVDEILKIRTNPKKILEKIARSIPEDLWIDDLSINSSNEIAVVGGSLVPRAIGEFITVLNDSPYFGGSISPTRQENKQETIEGQVSNYEAFELRGKVINFDMRSR